MEIVGSAVALIVESKVVTRMHTDRLAKTTTTFLKGRRFVWSVSSASYLFLREAVVGVVVPALGVAAPLAVSCS